MSKKNKSWLLEDKLEILKENLVEGKSVADICEAKGLSPSLFYTWRCNASDELGLRPSTNNGIMRH